VLQTEREKGLSPARYAQITTVAMWLLVFIVVTGAGVRLTGSGLGCKDWPTCDNNHLVAPWHWHAWVEFGNRLVTGLVSIAVVVAVLGALFRRPRRNDLTWLSLGLVGGVIAQIVLGGLVVLFKLNPVLVQGHFAVSMVLVANAVVLRHRALQPDVARRPRVTPEVQRIVRGVVGLAAVVLVTGTVVTGSGPHAGDEHAKRLPFTVHEVARIHGTMVFAFLAVVIVAAVRLQREQAPAEVMGAVRTLLFVLVMQAGIGYTQYFTGIPALLVALHVFGACLVWIAALSLLLGLSGPADPQPDLVA
jgi:cytochrome c oxidase assembly protein subunit 15